MKRENQAVILAGLLHDIGKFIQRGEFKGSLKVTGKHPAVSASFIKAKSGMFEEVMDNPIIRNPVTGQPYIPGSSLKGRMRSLLELKYSARTQQTGQPCDCGQCDICKIFGAHKPRPNSLGPTRIIVRDAFLTSKSVDELKAANQEKGIYYTEVKSENLVDRKKGKAEHPRPNERVPAESQFDFEIVLRIFEGDNENDVLNLIKEGLALVQKEYLGGSVSRDVCFL